jgi:hypothetical protein
MKKFSFVPVAALVAMFAFSPKMNAQSSTNFNKETFAKSVSNASDADKLALENIKMMNARIYQDLSKNFKGATEISATKADRMTFISCKVDGKMNRIVYSKNGKWQNTVTSYESDRLPEDIRGSIEYAYPRYSIFGSAIEVKVGSKTAYLVTIENNTSWKRIRMVDGEMDVYEEYQKQIQH